MDEHDKIIQDAEKEAERIINDAQSRISSLVDDHEITKRAYDQANDIIMNAQKNSKEIKTGTKHYADDILSKVEQILQETIDIVKVNRTEL